MKNWVYADCKQEWIDQKKTKFVNVEEGPRGEDRYTYVCPLCGEEHTSIVVTGSQPG